MAKAYALCTMVTHKDTPSATSCQDSMLEQAAASSTGSKIWLRQTCQLFTGWTPGVKICKTLPLRNHRRVSPTTAAKTAANWYEAPRLGRPCEQRGRCAYPGPRRACADSCSPVQPGQSPAAGEWVRGWRRWPSARERGRLWSRRP